MAAGPPGNVHAKERLAGPGGPNSALCRFPGGQDGGGSCIGSSAGPRGRPGTCMRARILPGQEGLTVPYAGSGAGKMAAGPGNLHAKEKLAGAGEPGFALGRFRGEQDGGGSCIGSSAGPRGRPGTCMRVRILPGQKSRTLPYAGSRAGKMAAGPGGAARELACGQKTCRAGRAALCPMHVPGRVPGRGCVAGKMAAAPGQVAEEVEEEAAEAAASPSRRLAVPRAWLSASGGLPAGLGRRFPALEALDVSGTGLSALGPEVLGLGRLHTLLAKNNGLGGEGALPKGLAASALARSLRVLNLSGNRFARLPDALLALRGLRSLSLGGNRLAAIPAAIQQLRSLEFLYLGGNFITSIPPELANLPSLSYLVLCDNKIQSIPPQLAQLPSLRSLSLHNNLLTYLPREILNLVHLEELSLRGNPLVVRFVRDLTYNPPSLRELAGRTVKTRNISYTPADLPENLLRYLDLASNCPNPKCGGVYFDSCVRQIKFVDFCGKYRLPLMHYLCSPECSSPYSSASQSSTSQSESDSEDEAIVAARLMQKVLLG
uniref:leucine-rich repeat-containing protein 58 n=1 Tax=Euleptes europaea TaxID=460621 RepID=UPI0025405F1C|nr:leucine-rich repeat-containing protein 58 [Euleptes europaea]